MPVEKSDDFRSNKINPIVVLLPNKVGSANANNDLPFADHGRSHVDYVLDSISPRNLN